MCKRNIFLLKGSLFFVVTFLFCVFSVFGQSCFFDVYDESCERFSSPFNTFNLNLLPSDKVERFEVSLYKKDNPVNEIALEVEGNVVRQLNPFTEAGVYVLEIDVFNKGGVEYEKKIEYVFDNLEPSPPIVPLNMESGAGVYEVAGRAQPGVSVFGEDGFGNFFEGVADSFGKFSFSVDLGRGVNYFKFYSRKPNGLESSAVERVIVFEDSVLLRNFNGVISSVVVDSLERLNERTVLVGENYVTSKRNFYVHGSLIGSDLKGTVVYVNGFRSFADSNGKFGLFVLLNEGDNEIVVEAGGRRSVFGVSYVEPNFRFLDVNMDKVVGDSVLSVSGSSSLDLDFGVYLNGRYVFEQRPVNGFFNFDLSGLEEGKNYLYLEGVGGKSFSEVFYYDTQSPAVDVLVSDKVSRGGKFLFEVGDDTGVDLGSVVVEVGGKVFSQSDVNVRGDFFEVDLSGFDKGVYDYGVRVKDRAGREGSAFGSFEIEGDFTFIERFDVEGGYQLGKTIFVREGLVRASVVPSDFVAFKSVYVDGERQENYQIRENGDVDFEFDFGGESGVVEFVFVNKNYEEFTESFDYVTDLERPVVFLDYVERAYSSGQRVKVTGKVLDSHFDWSSLKFNGKGDFLRFGDFFEAFVEVAGEGVSNLEVSGSDYAGNEFDGGVFGSLFLKSGDVDLSFSFLGNDSVGGGLVGSVLRNDYFVSFFDGFDFDGLYLGDWFELPVQEREGVRSVNMKGQDLGGLEFFSEDAVTVDGSRPEIYFVSYDGGILRFLIDGTLSGVVDYGVFVNGGVLDVVNSCDSYDRIGLNDECFEVGVSDGDEVVVSAADEAGNEISRSFVVGADLTESVNLGATSSEIFFSGNDLMTTRMQSFVQGQVKGSSVVKRVSVLGEDCLFDDFNFVCFVDLIFGDNVFEVSAEFEDGTSVSKEISMVLDDEVLSVDLVSLNGANVYSAEDFYYLVSDFAELSGVVSDSSLVSVLVGGNEIFLGERERDFAVPVSFEDRIFGKDSDEFEVWIEAEDENGRVGFSEKVRVVYNRIIETIAKVIVK